MKVAAVQFAPVIGRKAANAERILDLIREAAGHGAEYIVLPECALTGYCFDNPMEPQGLAEPVPGPFTARVAALAVELGVVVTVGLIEAAGTALFNTAIVAGPQGLVARYRKAHLPCLGFDRFATPGTEDFRTVAVGEVRMGVLICYDLRFPEAARLLTLQGADLIALPTNWPAPKGSIYPDFIVRTRACENRVYVVAANRVGKERGERFIGRSQIVDPSGDVLTEADSELPQTIFADVSLAEARNKRFGTQTYHVDILKDRRPDLYSGLAG